MRVVIVAAVVSTLCGVNGFSYAPPSPVRAQGSRSLAAVSVPTETAGPPTPGTVEFPPALSPLQRAGRALKFYSKVLPVLAAYQVQQIKFDRQAQAGYPVSQAEQDKVWAEIDEWGSTRIADTITDLRGFYVKTGQVISTRVDLFPPAYTSKLQQLQDGLEPMPFELVEAIVKQELLEGEPLSDLFLEFDKDCLGAASIAQVHRAVLADGREVAVKVQRPNVVPMLLGDVANLKSFSLKLRDKLPVDYYTVFSELGRALEYELDFLHEAQAAEKVVAAVSHTTSGIAAPPSIKVPLPIKGLASTRVMVMEYIKGTPLSKLKEEMERRGLDANSPESKLLGRRLLKALTEAYARMIFGSGFVHGDPHPGNIFIMEGGAPALIDCGQVKQLPTSFRKKLAESVVTVARYIQAFEKGDQAACRDLVPELADAVRMFGVTVNDEVRENGRVAEDECLAAVALLLFGTPEVDLPGGYSHSELSNESPIKKIGSFPQELVMLGRATVLIKGLASRLNIPWSLADKWMEPCLEAIECGEEGCAVPVWASVDYEVGSTDTDADVGVGGASPSRARFLEVRSSFRNTRKVFRRWLSGRGKVIGTGAYNRLPAGVQARIKARAMARMLKDE